MSIEIYFSEHFGVSPKTLEAFGTVDISLVSDLPLFLDPFLLFNSEDKEHQHLHAEIIRYLTFLRDKASSGPIRKGLRDQWFRFPEVRQLWMGYSRVGNSGTGLGRDFAGKLERNLYNVFRNFGKEQITQGSHLEKLCLIEPGVGRDHIADFTANLVLDHLAKFTAAFAASHLNATQVATRIIPRAVFSYETESWAARAYDLPIFEGDFVLLAPRRLLTKDETWINRHDLIVQLPDVIVSVDNAALRASINNYFLQRLPDDKEPTQKERREAAEATVRSFPELIEYFIRMKEEHGDEAAAVSSAKVEQAERQFIRNVRAFALALHRETLFYSLSGNTATEARARVAYLKDVIENKGGWRLFYDNGVPFRREADLQIVFRFTWFGTVSDVSREVDDGRGPADFKISRGLDKTIVEFKLASNSKLKQNLQHQTETYQSASDAQTGIKVIMHYSAEERERVLAILNELGLEESHDIVLIDASPKASASNVA